MTEQPTALRLADALKNLSRGTRSSMDNAATELRRLHDLNVVVTEALQYAIKQVPELATVPGISAAIAAAKGEA